MANVDWVLFMMFRNRLSLTSNMRLENARTKKSIIADIIGGRMSEKNYRDFWREIRNSSNSNVKLPNVVGNEHGSQNISGMWQEHYLARSLMWLGVATRNYILIYVRNIQFLTNV